VEQLKARDTAFEAQQHRSDAQINYLNQTIDKLEQHVEELKEQTTQDHSRILSLSAELASLDVVRVNLASTVVSLQGTQDTDQAKIAQLSCRVNDLVKDKENVLSDLHALKESDGVEIKRLIAEIRDLDERYKQLEYEKEAHIADSRDTIEQLSDATENLAKELDGAKDARVQSEQRVRELESQAVDGQEQLRDTMTALAIAHNKNLELTTDLDHQRTLTIRAQNSLSTVQALNEELEVLLEDERVALQNTEAACEEELQLAAREIIQKDQEVAEGQRALRSMKDDLQNRDSAIAAADRRNQQVEEERDAAYQDLAGASEKVQAIQEDLGSTQDALASSRALSLTLQLAVENEKSISAQALTSAEASFQGHLQDQEKAYLAALAVKDAEADALKNQIATSEAVHQVTVTSLQTRIVELEREALLKDAVIRHTQIQAATLVSQSLRLEEDVAAYRQAQAHNETDRQSERRNSADLVKTLEMAKVEKDQLSSQLKSQQTLSFQLDEELNLANTRLNDIIHEKLFFEQHLAESKAECRELQQLATALGCQMEDVRSELAQMSEQYNVSLERSQLAIEVEVQDRHEFEVLACENVEAVLEEKNQIHAQKKAAEKELAKLRRDSKDLTSKVDILKKENVELRSALKKNPNASEVYQAQQIVGNYSKQFASCPSCAITSTPTSVRGGKYKENVNTNDSFFGTSLDNILGR
jgi:uncharacterized protein YdbL (DUF1318 family)